MWSCAWPVCSRLPAGCNGSMAAGCCSPATGMVKVKDLSSVVAEHGGSQQGRCGYAREHGAPDSQPVADAEHLLSWPPSEIAVVLPQSTEAVSKADAAALESMARQTAGLWQMLSTCVGRVEAGMPASTAEPTPAGQPGPRILPNGSAQVHPWQ